MIYRLNFIFWRLRVVMQILVVYFLWLALFSGRNELFGYNQSQMLTYVLLTSLARSIILSTTTMEIGSIINQGNLSNYLIRPINFFRYYIARDIADKSLNVLFSIGEIALLYVLLRPDIYIQSDVTMIAYGTLAVCIGMTLYFYFSLLLGFLGFWTPDVWGPRFLSFVIMEFFAGGLFPLDILPAPLFALSKSLPFFYFIYFPIKIYLGQLPIQEIIRGIFLGSVWVGVLWCAARMVWQKGLRVYTAEGK